MGFVDFGYEFRGLWMWLWQWQWVVVVMVGCDGWWLWFCFIVLFCLLIFLRCVVVARVEGCLWPLVVVFVFFIILLCCLCYFIVLKAKIKLLILGVL